MLEEKERISISYKDVISQHAVKLSFKNLQTANTEGIKKLSRVILFPIVTSCSELVILGRSVE